HGPSSAAGSYRTDRRIRPQASGRLTTTQTSPDYSRLTARNVGRITRSVRKKCGKRRNLRAGATGGLGSPSYVVSAVLPVDAAHLGQSEHQSVRPVTAVSASLDGQVQLLGQGQPEHRQTHLTALGQGDS